jgi:hypothetical protein
MLLGGLLLGYVFFDRGFAHFGFAPLFVGEIVFAILLLTALITRSNMRFLITPAGCALLAFLFWCFSILLFNRGGTWLNSIRDSVIWGYGIYAILVASLLLRARAIETSLDWYSRWMPWFAVWAAPAFVLQLPLENFMPALPGSDVKIVSLKAGDFAVHLAGALTFLMLGLHRIYPRQAGRWSLFKEAVCYSGVILGIIACGSRNRGGLMSVLLAFVVVTVFRPNNRFTRLILPIAIVASFLMIFDVSIPTGGGREISLNQIADNVQSVFVKSDKNLLAGTVDWRLKWWNAILDDTLFGDRFWSGLGFGSDIAKRYGFADDTGNRSPHNGHITILARAGAPAAALWLVFILTLFAVLTRSYFTALASNQVLAAKLDLWVMAYMSAMLVNMSFDVYLEGPQGGIWFWCLAGFGIALSYSQRVNARARSSQATRGVRMAQSSPAMTRRSR